MSGGSGGAEHASPVATRSQGAAEDHRGRGGQLSRDSGAAAYLEGSQSFPRPLDTGERQLGVLLTSPGFIDLRGVSSVFSILNFS